MTLLVEDDATKRKKSLMLTEWPQSLIDALHAGILCGKAEEEAKALDVPRGQPLSHPWNRAVVSYRPIKAVEAI